MKTLSAAHARNVIAVLLTAASFLAAPVSNASPPGTPHVTLVAIGDSSVAEDGAGVSPVSMPGTTQHGAVYIWRRDDRNPSTWLMRSVVKSPNPGDGDRFGLSFAMCGTGNALAVGANGEDSKAKGVDGDRTDNSATDAGAAYLY